MVRRIVSFHVALLAGNMLAASPVLAADLTPERLLNPDMEPQNWLMNHRTYDGQASPRSVESTRTTSRS
jgi:hypothetical protein